MKRRDDQYAQQYQAATTRAETPSAAEQQREQERSDHFAWKKAGDYRKLPPGLINIALADPAHERAKREMEFNAIGTGVFGMGAEGANPTAVALSKQNLADQNEREQASNYEAQVRAEDLYQRTDNSTSLMNMDFARNMGLLNTASGMSQFQTGARIQSMPQSLLPAIISGGMAGLSAALGNPSGLLAHGHP